MLFDTEARTSPTHLLPREGFAPRRADAFLALLLAYPLLLLAISSNWIFTQAGYVDPWVYFGYFRDLFTLKNDTLLAGHYYGSRLSWLLPGFAAHRFLNPVHASLLLHLGVYYCALFSLYCTLRRTVGRRGALIAAILLGGYGFFLRAAGWDYVDGAGIAYCLLATACLTRAAQGVAPRRAYLAAGAAAAASVHANLVCLAFCPLFAAYWWILPRAGCAAPPHGAERKRLPTAVRALAWTLAGAAALTAALCVVNYAICGAWLFFLPSVRFAMSSALASNPWADSTLDWLPRANWLVLPAVVFAAVAATALAGRKQRRGWTYAGLFGALFAIECLLWTALELSGAPVLQLSYYASYLIPWLFLALGAALAPLLESCGAAGFAAAALVCGAVFPLPLWGVTALQQFAAKWGLGLPLACGVLLAAALAVATRSLAAPSVTLPRAATPPAATPPAATPRAAQKARLPNQAALALALFALCACHATLVPFSYTLAGRHAGQELFARITNVAERVRQVAGPADLLFWYDRQEAAFPEYLSLNSIFIWGPHTLGMDFPALPENSSPKPGTILVVPSARADAAGQARLLLEARGYHARLFHESVSVPGASYQIHFLKLEATP